ncbi:hypothetical protein [Salinicola aestuarinus]|uniref:hypothetical protein n=1 Tax=Salinicola aestuarinus TaxID=1949082 RepID=UPI000DA1E6E4|nr:hypothetical protein [Salinicola aestuarinus]
MEDTKHLPETEFLEELRKCSVGDEVFVTVKDASYLGELQQLDDDHLIIRGTMVMSSPVVNGKPSIPGDINGVPIPLECVTGFARDGIDYEKENGV